MGIGRWKGINKVRNFVLILEFVGVEGNFFDISGINSTFNKIFI